MRYPFLIFLLMLFDSCDQTSGKTPSAFTLPSGYSPDRMERITLSDDLAEISGIAWHEDEILAIEDESAIIYRLSPQTGKILDKRKFEKNRDIEDILVRNDTAWVLRSNGNLYRVVNFREQSSQTAIFEFPGLGKRDFEAAVSDIDQAFIWLFCKVCEWDKSPDQSSFFRFDLGSMTLDTLPAGKIEKSQLAGLLPDKALDKLKIQPSAAAVHPLTQEYFLLSSTGKWLMTLDKAFAPKSLHPLDPSLFKQPEGIAFAPDGTLYISNEARDGKANILVFGYRP